jgi:hypothetical protein
MGDKRSAYSVLVSNGGLMEKENLDNIGVNGRTIMIMHIQEVGRGKHGLE